MPRLILTVVALFTVVSAFAADTPRASIPYSQLAGYQKVADKLKDLDQLNISARIGSADPKIKPSDITLEAKLKSGQVVRIPIAADGAFTLPSFPEIAQEDPLLVSNLPKGSMGLEVEVRIKAPTITTQRYADLMRGLTQLNVAGSLQGLPKAPRAYGLLFAFKDSGHSLTLHTKRGEEVLSSETLEQARKHLKFNQLPDDGPNAFVYVAIDDEILKDNPQVTFDVLPISVVPAM